MAVGAQERCGANAWDRRDLAVRLVFRLRLEQLVIEAAIRLQPDDEVWPRARFRYYAVGTLDVPAIADDSPKGRESQQVPDRQKPQPCPAGDRLRGRSLATRPPSSSCACLAGPT